MERWAAHGRLCADEDRPLLLAALLWLSVSQQAAKTSQAKMSMYEALCTAGWAQIQRLACLLFIRFTPAPESCAA